MEKVSILIPVYNSEKYLATCIESLLNQTYKNIELVIVEDGSTDNSLDIIKNYAEKDDRISLYEKENEKNLAKTRNYSLSKITGELFAFVDSDDYVEPTYIEDLYNNMKKFNSDVSMCNFQLQVAKKQKLSKKVKKEVLYDRKEAIITMLLGKDLQFMLWNKLYKTKDLNNLRFDEDVKFGEDLYFVYNFTKNLNSFSLIDKKLYHYITHKNGETRSKFNEKHMSLLNGLKKMIETEEDACVKNALKAWLAFTSAGFLFLAKKAKHTIEEEQKREMVFNAKLHKPLLLKNTNTKFLYKFVFRWLLAFYVH